MSHKENCQWEDIYINIYDSNPCGADTSLTVEEDHLFYDSNVHKKTAQKKIFIFLLIIVLVAEKNYD